MDDPEQVPVAVAWARCMRDIGAIRKDSRNQAQNYSFRGIDALMNAAHPVFARHGIAVIPTGGAIRYEQHDRVTNAGKASAATSVFVEQGYTIVGPMGDTITGGAFGEGADTADKSTNKAMSAAFKYFLLQALCIPLEDMEEADRGDGANERPNQKRSKRAAEASAGSEPADPHLARRQALSEQIRGASDVVKGSMGKHMNEQGISLRRPCSPEELDVVEMQFANLTEGVA